MVSIEINGKKIVAPPRTSIIEAADAAGIYIPRFCYHPRLTVAANCRMCLVEVENVGKPLPACATPIANNMKIHTQSDLARKAQSSVMEFLLANHPLDCPICDQGGQCELQDLAMRTSRGKSVFQEDKRVVLDEDLGPLVGTEMTRCIHCTRCIRFLDQIAGTPELGAMDRGGDLKISTYVQKRLSSEISGNIIDLCPVGALVSKPARHQFRPWEIKQHALISPHDCLGSNVWAHVYADKIVRITPRKNTEINDVWISDRDRFSYLGTQDHGRCREAWIKTPHGWDKQSSKKAYAQAQSILKKHQGHVGGVISPRATLEEGMAFKILLEGLKSPHLEHRLKHAVHSHTALYQRRMKASLSLQQLKDMDVIILIGSDIHQEQPVLIATLCQSKATIIRIHVMPCKASFKVTQDIIVPCIATFCKQPPQEFLGLLTAKTAVLLGSFTQHDHSAPAIQVQMEEWEKDYQVQLMMLSDGANATGLTFLELFSDKNIFHHPELSAIVFFEVDPLLDCANPEEVRKILLQKTVIIMTDFITSSMKDVAQLILPIASFGENTGSFINVEGVCQSFRAAVPSSVMGYQVLMQCGEALGVPMPVDFEALHATAIHLFQKQFNNKPQKKEQTLPKLMPIKQLRYMQIWGSAASDMLTRAVKLWHEEQGLYCNSKVSQQLQTQNNRCLFQEAWMPVYLDEHLPDHLILFKSSTRVLPLSQSFGVLSL